jgi:hypothetical protein
MKRFLSVTVLTVAMVFAMSAQDTASARTAKHHRNAMKAMTANAACSVSDPSQCPSPCQSGAATSAAVVSHAAGVMTAARACPVSDPSACPASCRKSAGAAAVAASVTKH